MRKKLILKALVLAFLLSSGSAYAQENPEKAAREVVEQLLEKNENTRRRDLGSWANEVMKRALKRAGKNAPETPAPLPAESRAGSLAENLTKPARGPEVVVFMSLSVPAASWREWSAEAARIGAPLVLRGVVRGGLRATVKRVGTHLAGDAGAAIDPRLFRLFEIDTVPAVAVVPGGVPPCKSRGCSADPAPPHDIIRGNIGVEAALEAVAREGGAGRETARRRLAKLRGDYP